MRFAVLLVFVSSMAMAQDCRDGSCWATSSPDLPVLGAPLALDPPPAVGGVTRGPASADGPYGPIRYSEETMRENVVLVDKAYSAADAEIERLYSLPPTPEAIRKSFTLNARVPIREPREPKTCEELFDLIANPKPLSAARYPLDPADPLQCGGCTPEGPDRYALEYWRGRSRNWMAEAEQMTEADSVAHTVKGLHEFLDSVDEQCWAEVLWSKGFWVRVDHLGNSHSKHRARAGHAVQHDQWEPFTYKDHLAGLVRYYKQGKLVNPIASDYDTAVLARTPKMAPKPPKAGAAFNGGAAANYPGWL